MNHETGVGHRSDRFAIHSRLNWIALPGGLFSLQTVSEKRREPDIRIAEAV